MYNTPEQTIWQQLNYHLRDENITAITTISPYYDQNGQALQELLAAHPSATIHAVLDDRGRVPATMPFHPNVSFFDWKQCGVVRDKHARLHAKLIHWKAVNGTEYCLFGSANVTSAGLGLSNSSFTNAEASLLIEVPAGNVLTELGLVLNEENKRPLSSFRVTNNQPADQLATSRSHQHARLYSVEVELDELTIYWEADNDYLYQVHLFDKDDRLVGTLPADGAEERLHFKLSVENQKTQFVQVVDLETQQPVSNKLPVADLNQLYKTISNPILADIESIHAEILTGDMSRLLSLLTFAMNNEESTDQSSIDVPHPNPVIRSEPVQSADLALKAHTDYSFSDNRAEVSLLHSPALRVLDLLRFVRSTVTVAEYYSDIRVDEQETDLSGNTGSDASKSVSQSLPNKAACMSESRLIMNYLKQLTNYLTQAVAEEKPNEKTPVTITLLSKYLIALELLLKYGGKVVRYDDNGQYGSTNYLPFNEGENHTVKSIKGCCYLLIGSFLHLTRYGFKKYSLPYSQNKVEQFKGEPLVDTIVCLLNVRWTINEVVWSC